MDNTLYKKYAVLKDQIKSLEEEVKSLQPELLADLKVKTEEMVDKNLKFEFATFSLMERKNWTYSSEVEDREKQLKEVKKTEEENGIAKVIVTESIRCQI